MTQCKVTDWKQYNGRKVRIPQSSTSMISPSAGKLGVLTYAGWDDWFYVHVDGSYYCREQFPTIAAYLVSP